MKMNAFAAASAGMAFSLALAGAAEAATIRVVALTGQEAPGAGGAVFSFLNAPVLNNTGETAFIGSLTGNGVTSVNDVGIFTSGALVAREGDPAPGTGGAVFGVFSSAAPSINDAGQVAFSAALSGGGVNLANDGGIFISNSLTAREGDPAPVGSGVVFGGFSAPTLNDNGEFAARSFLSGQDVNSSNDLAIFAGGVIVAREGDAATGANGAVFRTIDGVGAFNDVGQVAFTASLSGTGVSSSNNTGLFTQDSIIAREGGLAPGAAGAVYSILGSPDINNSGEALFIAGISGSGVSSSNNIGVFTSNALIARSGSVAPGTGGARFSGFGDGSAINDLGEVVFFASLNGAGVNGGNNTGLFGTNGGVLELILREGDLLDIGGGDLRAITQLSFVRGGFNDNGDIAFLANFAAGVGGARGHGIFVYEADRVSAAVPLPPALGLMLFGVAALGFVGRRRARG